MVVRVSRGKAVGVQPLNQVVVCHSQHPSGEEIAHVDRW